MHIHSIWFGVNDPEVTVKSKLIKELRLITVHIELDDKRIDSLTDAGLLKFDKLAKRKLQLEVSCGEFIYVVLPPAYVARHGFKDNKLDFGALTNSLITTLEKILVEVLEI